MRMKRFLFLLTVVLISCSKNIIIHSDKSSLPLHSSIASSKDIDSIIKPYKDSMEKEMTAIIAMSDYDFIAKKPSSNLMNWVADATFSNVIRKQKLDAPVFCLLNFGSLRSTINKGKVTRGDLFTLMPFDNQVVIVQLPSSVIMDIENYILNTGGEPISNAIIENKKLVINDFIPNKNKYFYVITSDYLLNGGDRMTFFEKKIKVIDPNILLREALIEEAFKQKKLLKSIDLRIKE